MTDYNQLRLDEMASISETLAGLAPSQWDAPSLCDGWRVRDVVGHMLVGYTVPMDQIGAVIGQYGGDIIKASLHASVDYGSGHDPDDLAAGYERIWQTRLMDGIAAQIPVTDLFVDHVIHHADICRPLGLETGSDPDRVVAAMSLAPTTGGLIGCDARAAGLRMRATDADWSAGDGPEVAGTMENLLLALSGRPAGLDRLEGEGVATLVARVKG